MRNLIKMALIAAPIALVAHAASAETFVRMLSGPSGGSWYPYGAKMAEMWGNDIKGITTSNGPGGGVGNVRDVGRGNAQLGWTFGNTAYDGYNGKGKFKKSLKNVRFFANLYPGILQTAVPAKSKIRSYADLKGKNFSPGKLTFSGNIAVENLLKLYGVSYGDIKTAGGTIHRVGYKDSVALMKDGHIDAFVGLTTAPNSSFIALDFSPGIRFLGVDPFPPPRTLGARIIAKRRALGLSRKRLAKKLGVDEGALARWEKGVSRTAESQFEIVEQFLSPHP